MEYSSINRLTWLISATQLAMVAGLALMVLSRRAGNHISFEPRLLAAAPVGALVLLGVVTIAGASRKAVAAALGASVLLVAALVVMNQADLLLSYERWIDRGMPESPLREPALIPPGAAAASWA